MANPTRVWSGESDPLRRCGGRRWRGALVVVETALAVTLATGAGLMARSLQSLYRIDVGFEPEQVITASLERFFWDRMSASRGTSTCSTR